MTQDIIFKDEETAKYVADMARTVMMFRGTKVDKIFKTYESPNDTHYSLQVTGTAKNIHALQAVSWITYKTTGWNY